MMTYSSCPQRRSLMAGIALIGRLMDSPIAVISFSSMTTNKQRKQDPPSYNYTTILVGCLLPDCKHYNTNVKSVVLQKKLGTPDFKDRCTKNNKKQNFTLSIVWVLRYMSLRFLSPTNSIWGSRGMEDSQGQIKAKKASFVVWCTYLLNILLIP